MVFELSENSNNSHSGRDLSLPECVSGVCHHVTLNILFDRL